MQPAPGLKRKFRCRKFWRATRWLLALLAAVFYALIGWLRMSEALRNWQYLRSIVLYPDPRYIAISGGGRGLLFIIAFLFLLLRTPAALVINRMAYVIYLGWMWMDRIWIGTREAFYTKLPSILFFSAITLLIPFVIIQNRDYRKEISHGTKT